MDILTAPFCSHDPARSFIFDGGLLSLCGRCTGIYIGFLAAFLSIRFLVKTSVPPAGALTLAQSMLLILVLPLEVIAELAPRFEGSNYMRYLTGLAFGVGLASLVLKSSAVPRYPAVSGALIIIMAALCIAVPLFSNSAALHLLDMLSTVGLVITFVTINCAFIQRVFRSLRALPSLLLGTALFIAEYIFLTAVKGG